MSQRNNFAVAVALLTLSAHAAALPAGFATKASGVLASTYPSDGPGASVVITEHGKIVYEGTRGLADIASRRPITPATVFRMGSITKQFASATVLQLAAEGKLKLDDPIGSYLPGYPNGSSIRITQLLNHTSGIQDYTEIPGWMVETNTNRRYTTQELLDVFKNRPPPSMPGQKWAYNNSGYILVGALIESVTDKPWYQSVEERIIRPLGLSTVRYGIDETNIPMMATGYTKYKVGMSRSLKIDMSVPGAAGSLVGTPRDLAKWADALHHGKVVPAQYYARMITPTKLPDGTTVPYGFGLENGELRGHATIGHDGGIFGFTSDSIYVPDHDLFVAVFTNSDAPQTPVEVTSRRLAAMALGSPFPEFRQVAFDPKKVIPMLGTYKFKDTERVFGMRDGRLFTRRSDGTEAEVVYAGQNRFYYGPSQLSWFAIREVSAGKFVFERHADGADAIDLGVPAEK